MPNEYYILSTIFCIIYEYHIMLKLGDDIFTLGRETLCEHYDLWMHRETSSYNLEKSNTPV